MFEGINEIAVLVSALVIIAVGSVWYSPAVFGRPWMKGARISDDDMAASKDKMMKLFVLGAVANLVLAFVLATFLNYTGNSVIEVYALATFFTVLAGAVVANATIWEQKTLSYFLINIGYIAVSIFSVMSIVAYWPW